MSEQQSIRFILSENEARLIIDILKMSDPMGIYAGTLLRKLVTQFNNDIAPQGNIQPAGFTEKSAQGLINSDEIMIKNLENEIRKEGISR